MGWEEVTILWRVQVDAVWAGWGHASENPKLPDMLEKTDRKVRTRGHTHSSIK
jgi:acetyl-CoA carboxylase/biotin carboxylase 1